MIIRLINTKVEALSLAKFDGEDDFRFSYGSGFSDDSPNTFVVKFDITVESKEGYKIDLEYIADFQTENVIDDKFKESMFPIVNAPAIAYPYMRSLVGMITLNSGYEPVVLPTINFQAIASANKAK